MQPVIGITSNYNPTEGTYFLLERYVASVAEAGGVPFIIPHTKADLSGAVLGALDGLLLTGGTDFSPSRYGGQLHRRTSAIIEPRDSFEFSLTRHAFSKKVPIFGICRGMQIMNVVLGGTIYDDIEDQKPGSFDHRTGSLIREQVHLINVKAGSLLHSVVGKEELYVNSVHHQAVDVVADSLSVSALAKDGVIEAIEYEALEDRFFIGVQWHPEHIEKCSSSRSLFDKFIERALAFRRAAG